MAGVRSVEVQTGRAQSTVTFSQLLVSLFFSCRYKMTKNSTDFCAIGHSILHELTHLHSLALYAGLSPDPKDGNRAGTSDLQEGCELSGARDHLRDFKADQEVGSPDYNAESYAAAATGKSASHTCHWAEIANSVFSRTLFHGALRFLGD